MQNPAYLYQTIPRADLVNIKRTIDNHAELTAGIHHISLDLLSLLKMSKVDLFADKRNKTLYLMIIIPLFDPAPHRILNFTSNHLIVQPTTDSHTFSLIASTNIDKYTHGHDLLITNRKLTHRRTSENWNHDLTLALQSRLIDDVIFLTKTRQNIEINCGNSSKLFQMSNQLAIAIYIPHDCSLSSELVTIPTHNYHASISISQTLHLKHIKSNIDFSTHPDIHKDLLFANLTSLSIFDDDTTYTSCTLDFLTWIKISAICVSLSLFLWCCTISTLFIKGLKSHR